VEKIRLKNNAINSFSRIKKSNRNILTQVNSRIMNTSDFSLTEQDAIKNPILHTQAPKFSARNHRSKFSNRLNSSSIVDSVI